MFDVPVAQHPLRVEDVACCLNSAAFVLINKQQQGELFKLVLSASSILFVQE